MENEITMPTWMNKVPNCKQISQIWEIFCVCEKMSLSQRFGIVLMGWAILSRTHLKSIEQARLKFSLECCCWAIITWTCKTKAVGTGN